MISAPFACSFAVISPVICIPVLALDTITTPLSSLLFFPEANKFCEFLFASLYDETLLQWDLLLMENSSFRSEFFPGRKGGNNENSRVASPEFVALHLNKHVMGIIQKILSCFTDTVRGSKNFAKGGFSFIDKIINKIISLCKV